MENDKNVYQELKRQIVMLERKPGEVIREKDVMGLFDVSRTPVREALMRLEIDGLVRIIPNVGTFVEEITFQKLKDVFETRAHMVRLAGELAAARISAEETAEIRRLIDEMRSVKEDTKKLMHLDSEIHLIINRATRNTLLGKSLRNLLNQATRIWAYAGASEDYWQDLVKEFEEIATALEQHDGATTARLLEEHTNRFAEHVRSQLTF